LKRSSFASPSACPVLVRTAPMKWTVPFPPKPKRDVLAPQRALLLPYPEFFETFEMFFSFTPYDKNRYLFATARDTPFLEHDRRPVVRARPFSFLFEILLKLVSDVFPLFFPFFPDLHPIEFPKSFFSSILVYTLRRTWLPLSIFFYLRFSST